MLSSEVSRPGDRGIRDSRNGIVRRVPSLRFRGCLVTIPVTSCLTPCLTIFDTVEQHVAPLRIPNILYKFQFSNSIYIFYLPFYFINLLMYRWAVIFTLRQN